MSAIIKTEFMKIRRYQILLIGMLAMLCSPLLQFFSQMMVIDSAKNPNFDFAALLDDTIWGNTQIFMPVTLTLIGGYLISREYTDDTLKNILTVPVSFRKLLAGKTAAIGLLAVLLSVYNVAVTAVVAVCASLPGITPFILLKGMLQMTGLALCIYIVVLPIIIFCSRSASLFMGGSVVAFLTGYSVLFFKDGLLRDLYPFSAAFTIIGYDTSSRAGTSGKGSIPLAVLSLGIMLSLTALLLYRAKVPEEAHKPQSEKLETAGNGRKKPSRSSGRGRRRI